MNIGQAAKASGASAKMIRYYERIGLIRTAERTRAGYRLYTDEDVNTLRFIHRARAFGFPIERIRVLVALWQGNQPSREVKRLALEHAAELERRIAELTAMRDALQELANACHGDHRPECPILRDLESHDRPTEIASRFCSASMSQPVLAAAPCAARRRGRRQSGRGDPRDRLHLTGKENQPWPR